MLGYKHIAGNPRRRIRKREVRLRESRIIRKVMRQILQAMRELNVTLKRNQYDNWFRLLDNTITIAKTPCFGSVNSNLHKLFALAHEYGHALHLNGNWEADHDRLFNEAWRAGTYTSESHDHEWRAFKERRAWIIGEFFIPGEFLDLYKTHANECLATYKVGPLY